MVETRLVRDRRLMPIVVAQLVVGCDGGRMAILVLPGTDMAAVAVMVVIVVLVCDVRVCASMTVMKGGGRCGRGVCVWRWRCGRMCVWHVM